MRRPAPRPISVALDGFTSTLAPDSTLGRVQGIWERVVGGAIAAAATPTTEHGGTLTVACSAAVWAQELDLMSVVLLERLNEALGGPLLSRIRCLTE